MCAKVEAAANAVLGMIRRTFLCKDKHLILQLYHSLVRPQLEYSIQAWRPYLNNSSAVAEMGDRLATIDMGRKEGCCCAPFWGRGGAGGPWAKKW